MKISKYKYRKCQVKCLPFSKHITQQNFCHKNISRPFSFSHFFRTPLDRCYLLVWKNNTTFTFSERTNKCPKTILQSVTNHEIFKCNLGFKRKQSRFCQAVATIWTVYHDFVDRDHSHLQRPWSCTISNKCFVIFPSHHNSRLYSIIALD